MANQESLEFNNDRSVRFVLDSFALDFIGTRKKNTMYTVVLSGMVGTKTKLLPNPLPEEKFGYDNIAKWSNWIFASNDEGIFISDRQFIEFTPVTQLISPVKIEIVNDRLFAMAQDRKRIFYSIDLKDQWTPEQLMTGAVYIPEDYGECVDIRFYRNQLLVVCENGMLLVNKSINISHLSDDSQVLIDNLLPGQDKVWGSDWFTLGYATDTQVLREVFIKTDVAIEMRIESNRLNKTIAIKAANEVQKIKTNLKGDQFKISITVPAENFSISNISGIIGYGLRS